MMSDNVWKQRLMREALCAENARLPSAASTIKALVVIALAMAFILVCSSGLPDKSDKFASAANPPAKTVRVSAAIDGARHGQGRDEVQADVVEKTH